MSTRMIKFFKTSKEEDDSKWARQITKLHKYLSTMDKSKYLIPKYSETLEPLINFLKDNIVMNLNR